MWPVDDAVERPRLLTMSGPLIGRAAELDTVLHLLADPAVRVVVLTGPSGVGKTRLALAALDAAPVDARVLVPLSSIPDGDVMGDAIAAEVALPGVAIRRPADALWQSFGGHPVLLLLDNLEQVVGAAETLLDLLESYPEVTVLATSLREVGVPGERLVRLVPLEVPRLAAEPADPVDRTRQAAPAGPALEMFLERATARDAAGHLEGSDLAAAARICRSVGGLPLAIQLAAARAGSLPLPLIADQLEGAGGLTLLEQSATGVPERHRSLHAALTWTTGLLPPAAADLLAALSVFEGPATLEAIAAVGPGDDQLLDLLSTLLDVSLVEVDGTVPEEPLFSLLPTVRAFAADRLATSGGRAEALRRHDQLIRARCRAAHPLQPHEVADVLATLDRAQLSGSVDAALELALVAAGATAAPGATATVAARVEELLERPGDDEVLAARALVWSVTHRSTDVEDHHAFAAWTRTRVERAIRTARTSGDTAALLDALELTIRTLPVTLDRNLALAGIQEGLEVAERSDEPGRLARFRMWVGMATLAEGHERQAQDLLRLAFAGGSAAGDRVAADYAGLYLHAAGVTDSGIPGTPLPDLPALLDSSWRHHDRYAAAVALAQLVGRALDAGDLGAAARHVAQLLPIGAERRVVQPLVAATILTVGVRVLVAGDLFAEAAEIQSSLAPLDQLLQHSMSRTDHLAYAAALERLESARATGPSSTEATEASDQPPPTLRDAFVLAEKATLRLVNSTRPPQSPDPAVAATVEPLRPELTATPLGRLTAREREVLLMLAQGSGNRQIAETLGISSKTVMHHTVAIYRKLGVHGRTEAATWATRAGLTPG